MRAALKIMLSKLYNKGRGEQFSQSFVTRHFERSSALCNWNVNKVYKIFHYVFAMWNIGWCVIMKRPSASRVQNCHQSKTIAFWFFRVKAEIAKQGGLVDLMWDGNLKRSGVKSEWRARQQEAFSKLIKVD